MRSSAAMSRQPRLWRAYDNSIQTYAFPISSSGALFVDQKISPNWRRGCAELGFRNSQRKGRQRPNRERAIINSQTLHIGQESISLTRFAMTALRPIWSRWTPDAGRLRTEWGAGLGKGRE